MRIVSLIAMIGFPLFGQFKGEVRTYTRADSLRGGLRVERTAYDVVHYDLDIRVVPDSQRIRGSNTITFRATGSADRLQVDLFANMEITAILLDKKPVKFSREYNAVFVEIPSLKAGSIHTLRIAYQGEPEVGKNPPWDGGLIWTKDEAGDPWVAVACQGKGASLWWPTKDHPADEPDSMRIRVTVPPGLINVSNGKLRRETKQKDGWTQFDYAVTYPINNYNVTINVGKFVHFGERMEGKSPLTMDYYVLRESEAKAREQFKQVRPMMEVFEKAFGSYPFRRDGYKLVESPHLGMEHQSAVAYGNKWVNGYKGTSTSAEGVLFDFIIVHETAHEWWGNHVTAADDADMWIHESFGAYAEAVYVEGLWGYDAAMRYQNSKKQQISNQRPIIGTYGVRQPGSPDMYPKGAMALNTFRHIVDNDSLWWSILRGIQSEYGMRTIHADTLVDYLTRRSGRNFRPVFDQYFQFSSLPTLDVSIAKKGASTTLRCRWAANVEGFDMPIRWRADKGEWKKLSPRTNEWASVTVDNVDPEDISFAEHQFYMNVRKSVMYLDERLK